MRTEFTEFQKEAMMIIDLLRLHHEELEERLKEIFPTVQIRITARGIPIHSESNKADTMIYKTEHLEQPEEYLITASGANHLSDSWYDDKLFITFINMSNKNSLTNK